MYYSNSKILQGLKLVLARIRTSVTRWQHYNRQVNPPRVDFMGIKTWPLQRENAREKAQKITEKCLSRKRLGTLFCRSGSFFHRLRWPCWPLTRPWSLSKSRQWPEQQWYSTSPFRSGHRSKYRLSSLVLNFSVRLRTGALEAIWVVGN